jgi:hypothetical protein
MNLFLFNFFPGLIVDYNEVLQFTDANREAIVVCCMVIFTLYCHLREGGDPVNASIAGTK